MVKIEELSRPREKLGRAGLISMLATSIGKNRAIGRRLAKPVTAERPHFERRIQRPIWESTPLATLRIGS
jgi:hypothetical protein